MQGTVIKPLNIGGIQLPKGSVINFSKAQFDAYEDQGFIKKSTATEIKAASRKSKKEGK